MGWGCPKSIGYGERRRGGGEGVCTATLGVHRCELCPVPFSPKIQDRSKKGNGAGECSCFRLKPKVVTESVEICLSALLASMAYRNRCCTKVLMGVWKKG